jgi:excisionase family DNA binding protein
MSKLLKPREAARRLQVSERTLWANTVPRGDIPAVRIGNCVRYSEDALAEFAVRQTSTLQGREN